jgi:hypothetical protein
MRVFFLIKQLMIVRVHAKDRLRRREMRGKHFSLRQGASVLDAISLGISRYMNRILKYLGNSYRRISPPQKILRE